MKSNSFTKFIFASALFLDPLITLITSSKIDIHFIKPSKIWYLALAWAKSKAVLLLTTSLWWAIKASRACSKPNSFGLLFTIDTTLKLYDICISVFFNK